MRVIGHVLSLKMIRTRFTTYDLDELFKMLSEFEEKLTRFENKNINCTWDIKVLIGNYEYAIEILVTDESETDDNS